MSGKSHVKKWSNDQGEQTLPTSFTRLVDNGFTLVETMVALAILSIGLLSSIQINQLMLTQSAQLNLANDLQSLLRIVNAVIANPTACALAFGGQTFPPPTLPQAVNAGAGIMVAPTLILEPGKTYNSLKIVSVNWVQDLPVNTSYLATQGFQVLVNSHIATLQIITTSVNPQFAGTRTHSKMTTVTLGVDPLSGLVLGCLSNITEAAIACGSLGGTMKGPKCQLDTTTLCAQMGGTVAGTQCVF